MANETLKQRISEDTKTIQKSRDMKKLLVMRTLNSEIYDVEKKSGKELEDKEVIDVVKSAIKYRNEAKANAEKINDTAKIKEQEVAIELLMNYMPKQLTDAEAKDFIKDILEKNGISEKKDMGKAMKIVMAEINGKYDGKKVNPIVAQLLK